LFFDLSSGWELRQELRYRTCKPDDFEQLYAIEEACFEPPFRFSKATMRALTRDAHSVTWVAEEDGSMAGFAIVGLKLRGKSPAAYIQTIEVMAERRGEGVGGELIKRIEQSARDAGALEIGLHVDTANAAAIRLYESQGYEMQRRAEDFYPRGRAAFVYQKVLIEPDTSSE
jgi:ribosomal protein S18 acetylase RimI-like enzyme